VEVALRSAAADAGRSEQIEIKKVGCMGLCSAGPLVKTSSPSGDKAVLYQHVEPQHASELVHSIGAEPVARLQCDTSQPFFARQMKIVLENCGVIDPENLNDYVAAGGYTALHKALSELSPQEVLAEVTRSGLRGRGGAGYPVGLKWNTVAKSPGPVKYVVCNADEGDPGAFMDRSVLESDPHRVIEGMAIAGYAVGAQSGYVYVRAEYPLAIERLRKAIRQALGENLIGTRICGTEFDFSLDIRLGAGAFVCGEETALLASIEGKRGQPRPRPPYPAQSGLFGRSTLINNVETFANIAPIIRNGGEWLSAIGTERSKGTKVFALAGQVKNTGLIEVPMGISLREIVQDMGGGVPGGGQVKAVQTGGPSGGCIPFEHLDMPVDYDSLQRVGSIMGSGGMIVIDDSASMVDVARYFMEFCMSESCGKCVPCRVGTHHMHGPNLIKARSTSQAGTCVNNLRQVDSAKSQWALEFNKTTETPTGGDLQSYMGHSASGSLPYCPLDEAKAFASSYSAQAIGTAPTCEKGGAGKTLATNHILSAY
jgi:bidirectional [NiFe] hydrogenase diaphorase subunit